MKQRLFLNTDSSQIELRALQFNMSGQLIYVEDLDYNMYYFEKPIDLLPKEELARR